MTDRFSEPLVDALRHVHVFEDLDASAREWLAQRMDDQVHEAGSDVFTAGQPAEHMAALIAGEVHIRLPGKDEPFIFVKEGDVSGVLPYSRMTTLRADARTVKRSRVARLHRQHFADLLREHPRVGERLVWLMADRIREFAVNETHREKLMALGKLSAGLAHELNNPAAAVQRAASQLCTLLSDLQREAAGEAAAALADRLRSAQVDTDPLARSDRERGLRQWSRAGSFDVPRDALTALADAGIDAKELQTLLAHVAAEDVAPLLVRITMAWRARALVDDIEEATSRIAGLVRAIK
jgi:CRP-like cAMP-binding protein